MVFDFDANELSWKEKNCAFDKKEASESSNQIGNLEAW